MPIPTDESATIGTDDEPPRLREQQTPHRLTGESLRHTEAGNVRFGDAMQSSGTSAGPDGVRVRFRGHHHHHVVAQTFRRAEAPLTFARRAVSRGVGFSALADEPVTAHYAHPMPPRLLGPAEVRALAAELGLRPTKQRGQNFVIDPNTVRRIVREARLEPDDVVLEVGPGLGSLTLALLEQVQRVTAIEIDPLLAGRLPQTVAECAPDEADGFVVVEAAF